MEPKMKSLIEETVMEILKKADTEGMNEFKLLSIASEKLRTDLSQPEYQQIIQPLIVSFLISMAEESLAESPPPPPASPPLPATTTEENKPNKISNEEDEEKKRIGREPSIASIDNLNFCKPFKKRKVLVEDYRRKTLVSATKYHLKDPEQSSSPNGMEPEFKRKIEETVMEILNKAESDDMSELKVQRLASEKLGMDLSGPDCEQLVKLVIETFLISMAEVPVAEPAVTKEEITEDEGMDEYGNAIVCKPSSKSGEKAEDFKGKTLLIKEHCQKDGKHFPSSRGCNIVVA